jgi:hypothetical protein
LITNYLGHLHNSEFDGKIIHFSFDDVCWCLNDLIVNGDVYSSIWENAFFVTLKNLHDATGCVFTLNVFNQIVSNQDFPANYDITNVPNKFQSDFRSAKNWLKFGFHAGNEDANYGTTNNIQPAYNTFVSSIYTLTGDYDCIDRITRLHYYSATFENCMAIKNIVNGAIIGFLGADDTRSYDYYLLSEQYNELRDKGKYADIVNQLYFITTLSREILTSSALEAVINSHPCYKKFTEVFFHEQEYYGLQDRLTALVEIVTDLATWANNNGYIHYFPSLILK